MTKRQMEAEIKELREEVRQLRGEVSMIPRQIYPYFVQQPYVAPVPVVTSPYVGDVGPGMWQTWI